MNLSEIFNTVCLLKALSNEQRYTKSTHKINKHKFSDLLTAQIVKQISEILVQ